MGKTTQIDLERLIQPHETACVSLYMPTHRAGKEAEQDPIRFKNLLREAQSQLRDSGMRAPDAQELLAPAQSLRADELFWRKQGDGLALFCTTDFFSTYRLPLRFAETVHVGRRFFIKPLLPLLQGDGRFYILALSQSEVNLYQASRYSIREMDLSGLHAELEFPSETRDADETLQHHLASPRNPVIGNDSAIFHGQGGGEEQTKQDIHQFFQRVDRGLRDTLRGESAPMVLACVGYLASIYESTNSYPNLVEGKVPGNPKMWSPDELHARAWGLVEPYFKKEQDQAKSAYWQAADSGRITNDLQQVAQAAEQGRIATLFLARDLAKLPESARNFSYQPGNGNGQRLEKEDLLDYVAAQTLVAGGTVFTLDAQDLPGKPAPAAALLRFAVTS
ncbi:MAG: hypothetical protein WDZ59_11495 [Pirellulales bacterium]